MKVQSLNIELIKEKLARSDEGAFRELFDVYYPRLLNYAFVIVKNHESAEDIVLEVLHNIWQHREKLSKIDRLESYLYVCVKNKTLDYHRKNSQMLQEQFSEPHFSEQITHQNPENQLLNKELLSILDQSVIKLPEKTRLVYRLIKEDGLTYQEAADILGVSVKTINNQLLFAVKTIRASVLSYISPNRLSRILRTLKSLILF
jgi:RNA polymerase sigma-70 factor (ECF subfamily)